MNKPIKCFVVEGEDRDYRFINEMIRTFFKGRYESITICLPAGQNIYMLYNRMKEDRFETDLIELLREDNKQAEKLLDGVDRQSIDEIYLFFDYDIHQNNLPIGQDPLEVLEKMLLFYDNETENGKLYISYPMVEALYDYQDEYCEPVTYCRYPLDMIREYKTKSGQRNPHASRHLLKYEDWRMILSVFGLRIQCLFDADRIDYSIYSKEVSAESIFHYQKRFINQDNSVFVLSAFPEFLLDYFKKDFWVKHIIRHKNKYDHCLKEKDINIPALWPGLTGRNKG